MRWGFSLFLLALAILVNVANGPMHDELGLSATQRYGLAVLFAAFLGLALWTKPNAKQRRAKDDGIEA